MCGGVRVGVCMLVVGRTGARVGSGAGGVGDWLMLWFRMMIGVFGIHFSLVI